MLAPLPIVDELKAIAIDTPCTVPWEGMSGDDRSRFCGQCRQRVFDLSTMTSAEAAELLSDPAGRPCVRLYRRPDGRVLTTDCPAGLRTRVWRRLRRRAAWAASLFAVLCLPACRIATQGLPGDIHADALGKLPAPNVDIQPCAEQAKGDERVPAEQSPPNALADFSRNEFNAWSISPRVDYPVERNKH
jgi:hypothetical protein